MSAPFPREVIMTVDLAPLMDLITQAWLIYGLVFLRVGTAILVLPGLGEATLPTRLRLAAAIAMTVVIAPLIAETLPSSPSEIGWRIAVEPLTGLALGLVVRLFVLALITAGTIIAQASSLAQMFGGATGEPQPAVGHLLTMGGLAIAFASGLHIHLPQYLLQSYLFLPVGTPPPAGDMQLWAAVEVARTFVLAFRISAPFVISALIYNVALGAINRAMPQLMVAFVGAPALTLGALALMIVAIPSGLSLWLDAFHAFLANPTGGLG